MALSFVAVSDGPDLSYKAARADVQGSQASVVKAEDGEEGEGKKAERKGVQKEHACHDIAAAVEDKTEYVAEELLERLEREHGVSVDEELRTWRVARVDRRGRRYR